MLPGEITVRSTKGDRQVRIEELGATDVPDHDGGSYASELNSGFGRHRRDKVKPFLCAWTFPEEIQAVKERVEQALEDGVPDQKRTMLRNQDRGMLDDRWISDIAMGDEVDRPFQRWSKKASGEIRVTVCLDACAPWYVRKEVLESRMVVAAGICSALEALDYEVSAVSAALYQSCRAGGLPRTTSDVSGTTVLATVLKSEEEPMVDSGFAHLADTDLRRLVCCWVTKDNNMPTHLSNSEWRELTDADLFIYLGPTRGDNNAVSTAGLPRSEPLGPSGDDALVLKVNGYKDLDKAVHTLEAFFADLCGGE